MFTGKQDWVHLRHNCIPSRGAEDNFKSDNTENDVDNRSDNKGPEPEGLALAELWDRTFLFLGLERIGGIAVFDVTDPHDPEFVIYENPRDFAGDPEAGTAGDLGPERLIVVHRWNGAASRSSWSRTR